ncbi:hypothetical protein QBC47DRAFT_433890 [Echria macrotheca]|uniref:Uncharacterized protein n=1 Tax=Echria macrotheca TaxID=438768 RepID=A0AAJ0B7W8_9PEZI|nr:hypothetical protein QBC47DRAFT_433890 [Echria macrotheca]
MNPIFLSSDSSLAGTSRQDGMSELSGIQSERESAYSEYQEPSDAGEYTESEDPSTEDELDDSATQPIPATPHPSLVSSPADPDVSGLGIIDGSTIIVAPTPGPALASSANLLPVQPGHAHAQGAPVNQTQLQPVQFPQAHLVQDPASQIHPTQLPMRPAQAGYPPDQQQEQHQHQQPQLQFGPATQQAIQMHQREQREQWERSVRFNTGIRRLNLQYLLDPRFRERSKSLTKDAPPGTHRFIFWQRMRALPFVYRYHALAFESQNPLIREADPEMANMVTQRFHLFHRDLFGTFPPQPPPPRLLGGQDMVPPPIQVPMFPVFAPPLPPPPVPESRPATPPPRPGPLPTYTGLPPGFFGAHRQPLVAPAPAPAPAHAPEGFPPAVPAVPAPAQGVNYWPEGPEPGVLGPSGTATGPAGAPAGGGMLHRTLDGRVVRPGFRPPRGFGG